MTTQCLVRYAVSVALLATINSSLSTFAQGSLNPPGPPAPIMKSLAQIEPRTPISALPYTISQPGSYYLTTNLSYAAGNAITVTATNVSIDLNGFALTGGGTNSPYTGISSTGASLAVRNGIISGWLYGASAAGPNNNFEGLLFSLGAPAGAGVHLTGGGNRVVGCDFQKWGGVLATGSGDAVLDCSVFGSSVAPGLSVNDGCTISRCTVSFGGGMGIVAGRSSTISQCNAYFNDTGISTTQYNACLIVGCSAVGNNVDGIDSGDRTTIMNCSASENGFSGITTGQNCTVKDCTACYNLSYYGILAGAQCLISGCSANANGAAGVLAGAGSTIKECTIAGQSFGAAGLLTSNSCTVIGCGVSSNSIGISAQSGCSFIGCTVANNGSGLALADDGLVKDCIIRANTGNGISANNHLSVANCTLASNTATGIVANFVCKVADCVAVLNGGFGISLGIHGQVTGCHLNANTSGGIKVTGDSLVRDNMVDFHQTLTTTPGISVSGSANRIEANNVTRAGHGLDVSGTGNIVIRNSVSGSTGLNYNLVANNSVGVIVQASLSGAISGNTGGAGLGSTDPWANFSY